MYQIYIVIGAMLLCSGIINSSYFLHYIKVHSPSHFVLNSLSDSLCCIFISIFYIYCACELSHLGSTVQPLLNFHGIDETYINSTLEEMPQDLFNIPQNVNQSNNIEPTENDVSNEVVQPTVHNSYYTTTEAENIMTTYPYKTDQTESSTIASSSIKDDREFLNDYKNFFEEIIKQKLTNNTTYNRTIFFNNKRYKSINQTQRQKREYHSGIRGINLNLYHDCLKESFLKHAMLLYSFLYCVISLTCNCQNYFMCEPKQRKCRSTQAIEEKPEIEASSSFASSTTKDPEEPNLDIFLAKSVKTNYRRPSISHVKSVENSQENDSDTEKLYLFPKIVVMWIFPSIFVIILYFLIYGISDLTLEKQDENYFNATRANADMLNLISTPINISTSDKKDDINNIIKNVYHIVNNANQNLSHNTNYYTPVMFDIIYFLNKHRHPKDFSSSCILNLIPLKVSSFILISIYFGAILYSKLRQANMALKSVKTSKLLIYTIIIFALMWIPSILEQFTRTHLMNSKFTIVTDIVLFIGNMFVTFINVSNYIVAKNIIKNFNFIEPNT